MTETQPASEGRWHSRPMLSTLLRGGIFITPIAISIASAVLASRLLARPHGLWELAWWATVLTVPMVVLVATDRIARKALPLAVLLQMTMVFPDQAPKRLAVARRAGTTRDLARRVEEAKTRGHLDQPTVAAERILSLAAALNAHDRLTRGHGERVRAITDLIAEEMRLPTEDRDRLRWSALLHDIGKLTVHPHVLNKPNKLNEEEWAAMRNHPLEGAKLTAPLAKWLGRWTDTIAEHHERYDGRGYPHGLAGDAISLGARIVAVADSYDVMTSVRSYKQPISAETARAELAACAGAQFDPQVVRAFLDVSVGRLRLVAGPLAWFGSLPFLSSVPQLGRAALVLGRVGAASAVVGGALTVGTLRTEAPISAVHHLAPAIISSNAGNGSIHNGGGRAQTGPESDSASPIGGGSQLHAPGASVENPVGSGSRGSGSASSGSDGSGSGDAGSDGSGSSGPGSGSSGPGTATTDPTTPPTTALTPTSTTTPTPTTITTPPKSNPSPCLLGIICL